jgi:hypothetical protein
MIFLLYEPFMLILLYMNVTKFKHIDWNNIPNWHQSNCQSLTKGQAMFIICNG